VGKFSTIQNSFKSGAISQKLIGRTDLEERPNAVEKMENFLVMPEGGAVRRPGSRQFTQTALTQTNNDTAIFPFIVSQTEAYLVVLYSDNSGANRFGNFEIYNSIGNKVAVTSLSSIGTFATITSDGFSFAQVADIMIITHSSGHYEPLVVLRTATSAFSYGRWTGSAFPVLKGNTHEGIRLPFKATNTSALTLTWDSGTGKVTASAALFDIVEDVGRRVRMQVGSDEGILELRVDAGNSTTVFKAVNLISAAPVTSATATTDWSFSEFTREINSPATKLGIYPRTVAAFQQRLIFGGTSEKPDTLWASKTGNLFHFMQERLADDASTDVSGLGFFGAVKDTDPFATTPASNQVNAIQWLMSSQGLEIGTLGAEYTADIVAANNVSYLALKEQTSVGGSDVSPVRIGASTIFVSRDGKRVREFIFNDRNGTFLANNLTVLNSDILYHGFDEGVNSDTPKSTIIIEQLNYQQSRDIVWALTNTGVLFGLTLDKQAGTAAWHTQTLGGTGVVIKSLAVLPNATGDYDELHMALVRTVGTSKFFIETIGADFNYPTLANESPSVDDKPIYLDCSMTHTVGEYLPMTILDIDAATETLELTSVLASNRPTWMRYLKVRYDVVGGAAIGGLTTGTEYYIGFVDKASPYTVKLCTSLDNVDAASFINITGTISVATHTLTVTGIGGGYTLPLASQSLTLVADGVISTFTAAASPAKETRLATTATFNTVTLGYNYTSTIRTLKLEAGGSFGAAHNSIQRVNEISVDFYNSYYAQYGRSENKLYDMKEFQSKNTPMTGEITLKHPGGSQNGDQVTIQTNVPLPLTVLAIIAKGVTYDG